MMMIKKNILHLNKMALSTRAFALWNSWKEQYGKSNPQLFDDLVKHAEATGFIPKNRDTRKSND